MSDQASRAMRTAGVRGAARAVAILLAGALLSLGLAACGGTESDDAGSGGGTLTIAVDSAFTSLNPATDSAASSGGFVLYLPYATLVQKDPKDGAYGPGLAETYGFVGEGNKEYELKLRPDLKFADGTALDSAAVKTWFEYFPQGSGGYAALLDIASIETPDELTVRVKLKSPTPLVTDALAGAWGMVLSPKAVADPDQLDAGAPGAGPYKYDQTATVTGSGATYVYVPNEHYHDQSQVKWSKVVVKVIEDAATRLRALQSGEVDVATGATTTVGAAEKAGLDVSQAASGWYAAELLDSNGTKVKALGDLRVRQALNYAVDRKSIAKAVYDDAVAPISAVPTADGYDEALADRYPYDPAKAKELLAEAGYADGFEFTIVSSKATTDSFTQVLAQSWSDIGVKAKVVTTATNGEFFEKFLTESAFSIPFPLTLTLTLGSSRYTPTSPLNPYGVKDSVLDDLYAKAQVASPEEQESILKDYAARITEQAYSVPVTTNAYMIYSRGIDGVDISQYINVSPGILDWSRS